MEKHRSKTTPKDVFSYLLMIATLYVGVIAFITLLWQYINVQFPDPLEYYYTSATMLIRQAISGLLVVWPVFLLLSWVIARDIKVNKEKADIWVRKWLLYLTLFIAAITIIADLYSLTNSYLGGELTMRFVLKVAVILAVAIVVFGYYLWELRRDLAVKTNAMKITAVVSTLVIIATIVLGFFVVGSPVKQRAIRMDEQRVSDLQNIQYQVIYYWQQKEELPTTLDDLKDDIYGYSAPVDPITGVPYTYKVDGDLTFSLCATFSLASDQTYPSGKAPIAPSSYPGDPRGGSDTWTHDAGTDCFERTIDPEIYKVTNP